jgi:hypothetical protein
VAKASKSCVSAQLVVHDALEWLADSGRMYMVMAALFLAYRKQRKSLEMEMKREEGNLGVNNIDILVD